LACDIKSTGGSTTTSLQPGPFDFFETGQPGCWDGNSSDLLPDQPFPPSAPTGVITSPGTTEQYWIQAVDPANGSGNGVLRATPANNSAALSVTENELNVRPTPPGLTVTNVNGTPCLSWLPSTDADINGGTVTPGVQFYRVYRTAASTPLVTAGSTQVADVPYTARIARNASAGASCDTNNSGRPFYSDTSAGADTWFYTVTAVDKDFLESYPSNEVQWTPGS
jgi:hypothetical protein